MITLSELLLVFVNAINFVFSLPQIPNQYQGQEQFQGPLQYQGPSQYQGQDTFQGPLQYQGLPQYRGSQQYEGAYQFQGAQHYQGADQFQGAQYQGANQYQEALRIPQQIPNTEEVKEYPLGPLQNISPDWNAWLQKHTDPDRTDTATLTSNCSKADYATLIEMDQGKRKRTVDDSNSCYFACYLKELRFINEEGLYNAEDALEHAKKVYGFADRRLLEVLAIITAGADCKTVNTTPVSDGVMGCDRAKLLFDCWGKADEDFNKQEEPPQQQMQPENQAQKQQKRPVDAYRQAADYMEIGLYE